MSDDNPVMVAGNGSPGNDCGQPVLYWCNSCHSYFKMEHSCMSRYCPECYTNWASREARAAAARLWGWKISGDGAGAWRRATKGWGVNLRVYHVVVSFNDPGFIPTESAIRDYRRIAYGRASMHGAIGGLAVFHGGRAGEHYLSGGPHVHLLLVGGLLEPGGLDGAERDGRIVWAVIQHGDSWAVQSESRAKRAVAYLLTHCLVGEGLHSLTWFGWLSYNKWRATEPILLMRRAGDLIDYEPNRACPYCHSTDVVKGVWKDYTPGYLTEVGTMGEDPPPWDELPLGGYLTVHEGVAWPD